MNFLPGGNRVLYTPIQNFVFLLPKYSIKNLPKLKSVQLKFRVQPKFQALANEWLDDT
jgi:hypothetical protein